jgi:hypothetical protein
VSCVVPATSLRGMAVPGRWAGERSPFVSEKVTGASREIVDPLQPVEFQESEQHKVPACSAADNLATVQSASGPTQNALESHSRRRRHCGADLSSLLATGSEFAIILLAVHLAHSINTRWKTIGPESQSRSCDCHSPNFLVGFWSQPMLQRSIPLHR